MERARFCRTMMEVVFGGRADPQNDLLVSIARQPVSYILLLSAINSFCILINPMRLLHYISTAPTLVPIWGLWSPWGPKLVFGPHFFQSPHFLHFRPKNASKVSAATI